MNSKKLTILISILSIVILIVVLASTVFTLKTVSFNFLNQRNVLRDYELSDYLKKVSVPYGDSIFFVNKEELVKNLESENAYLEVISIETTFPNNIVIHASEREEVFAIKFDEDTYAITDKNLKILKFCNFAYLNKTGYLSPIIVDIGYDDVELIAENYSVCGFINIKGVSDVLLNLCKAFEASNYSITTFKGFATGITMREAGSFKSTYDGGYDLNFVKTIEMDTKYGIKLSINDAYSSLPTKVALALKAYEREHDNHNTSGEILVFEQEDRFVARYKKA